MRTTIIMALWVATLAGCGAPRPETTPHAAATVRGTYRLGGATRDYVVHVPASSSAARAGEGALVVMLHGCTQDASDAARGTRLNEWAEREGFAVLYPEQPASANPKKCWNWYLPSETTRGAGEVALLAALVDSVAGAREVPPARVALVGMSAGAAMAASLAIAHPDRYGALIMHSGVPAHSASDVMSAVTVMRQGVPDADALGARTRAAMGSEARGIPVLLIHGDSDVVVSPANVDAIARQWTAVNFAGRVAPAPVQAPPRVSGAPAGAMRGMIVRGTEARERVEWWRVRGLGHAWSGGAPSGTFTAPSAPDATALAISFLREVWASR